MADQLTDNWQDTTCPMDLVHVAAQHMALERPRAVVACTHCFSSRISVAFHGGAVSELLRMARSVLRLEEQMAND
jgi:hypothetical protein